MTTPNNPSWMDFPIPCSSPRLRALIERMDVRVDSLAQSIGQVIFSTISDYGLSPGQSLRDDQRRAAAINARIWHRTLLTGTPPVESELALVVEHSRRRVHQGISLSSLLRAYRIGSRTLWMEMLKEAGSDGELQQELLLSISPYFMHHFDLIAQAMAQAWTAEQFQQERWRDRLRHELWTVVSVRPEDVDAFRRHATDLGLDPTASVCAIAISPATSFAATAGFERLVDQMLTPIARVVGVDRDAFMRAVHHGQLVLWLSANHGEPLVDHCRRVNALAVEIARQVQNVASIGVGLPGTGPRGWQVSAEQAQRARSFVIKTSDRPGVMAYSDIVLDDLVSSSDNVKRFFDSLIERLAVEPHLLDTLAKYFELKQHRKAVAAALSVHPNTLDNRLERIEQLLGANLSDMAWMAKLHTALQVARVDRSAAQ